MPRKRRGRPGRVAVAPTAILTLPPSQPSAKLEFRSLVDDAWYSSWLQLEGEILCVMYIVFPDTNEERFPANQFETVVAIEEFRDRFRPESVPVEDEKCAEVMEGTVVCAFNKYQESELKFYDAAVDSVLRTDSEDKCSCMFNLLWQHGPLDKKKTVASIDNICLIQSRDRLVDPILDSFLDLARSKVEARNTEVGRLAEMTPTTGGIHTFGKNHNSRTAQDIYLGSSIKRKTNSPECYFFFRVSNLEKDITPICIMDFIFQQTNISSVALVFPAMLPESFSTGTIFVETKEKYERLSEFLLNPGHLIMSLRGRPWVLNAKWNGSMEGSMPKYESQLAEGEGEHCGKLKLATTGVMEYEMGVELHKLHMEFLEYKEGLHESLETEITNIARRFPTTGTN